MLIHALVLLSASLVLQQANANVIPDEIESNSISKLFQEIKDRQIDRDSRSILGQQFSAQTLPPDPRHLETSLKSLYKPHKPPKARLVKIRIKFGRNRPESTQPAEHRNDKTNERNSNNEVARGRDLESDEVIDRIVGEREKEFGKKSLVEVGGREVLEGFESGEVGDGPEGRGGGFGEILKELEIGGKRPHGLGQILIQRRRMSGRGKVGKEELDEENDNEDEFGEVSSKIDNFEYKYKENLEVSETINPVTPLLNLQHFQTNQNLRRNPANMRVMILRKPLRRNFLQPNASLESPDAIIQVGGANLARKRPHRVKLVAHRGPQRLYTKMKTEEKVTNEDVVEMEDLRRIAGELEDDEEGLDQTIQVQNYEEVQEAKAESFENGENPNKIFSDSKFDEHQDESPSRAEDNSSSKEDYSNSKEENSSNRDQNLSNEDVPSNFDQISKSSPSPSPNITQPSQDDLKELRLNQNSNRYSLYKNRLRGNVD